MKHYPQRGWRQLPAGLAALLSTLLLIPIAPSVHAHGGGAPRLTNEAAGPYRLYAWSEPEPWRVGQVHLSLAVTLPNPDNTGNQLETPVTDVDITVIFTPLINNTVDETASPVVVKAVRQESAGGFYYEVDPVLARQGDWQIEIEVAGPEGAGRAQFAMQTLPARVLNWSLVAIAGGVIVVLVILFVLWSRAQRPARPVQHRHRSVRRVQNRSKTGVGE